MIYFLKKIGRAHVRGGWSKAQDTIISYYNMVQKLSSWLGENRNETPGTYNLRQQFNITNNHFELIIMCN